MITQIGITAGDIWHFLDEHGVASLDDLIVGIEKPRELVLMSLGWLARENHVLVETSDDSYFVSLKKKEEELT